MNRLFPMLLVFAAACLFAIGCGKIADNNASKAGGNSKSGDGHDGHDHDGHDHDGHSHSGEKIDLGTNDLDGVKVQVTQFGHIEPAHEMVFEIKTTGGDVSAIRGWFGTADPTMHRPANANKMDGGMWDLHLEGVTDMPEHGHLFLEVTVGGQTKTTDFHAHVEGHEGHDHDHE